MCTTCGTQPKLRLNCAVHRNVTLMLHCWHIGMQDFVHSIQITHKNTDNNTLFIKFQSQTETVMFLY